MSSADLRAFGNELLAEFAAKLAQEKEQQKQAETYLTKNQVCELMGVNLSTLWRWEQSGYLIPACVGGRKRYTRSSITQKMEGKA